MRGLVFVPSDDPEQKLGEVYYERDPSWQHEMVSGLLSSLVAVDLGQLAGKSPSDMLFTSLLVFCCRPEYPLQYVDRAFVL